MMDNSTTYGQVARALRKLANEGPGVLAIGICSNLVEPSMALFFKDVSGTLPHLFSQMGLDREYPVECPEMSPAEAYLKGLDLWDRTTEYGRNRWALLDRLIAFVEQHDRDKPIPF